MKSSKNLSLRPGGRRKTGARSKAEWAHANLRTCITHRYAEQSKRCGNKLLSPVPPQWTAVGVHWTGGNGRPIQANPSAEQAAGKGLHRPKAASPAERFRRLESHGKERKRCPAQEGGAKGLSHRPQKWVLELFRHRGVSSKRCIACRPTGSRSPEQEIVVSLMQDPVRV